VSTDSQASSSYVIESGARDYNRLLGYARAFDEHVQDGCRRAGLSRGQRVVDVGCGPLGALLSLANLVGPTGSVVGLDFNPEALATARSILNEQGLSEIQLVQGEINAMALEDIPRTGSFDLAYCRLFLFHQRDPVATLRRMGRLVRPGGTIVAHEMVPVAGDSDPPLPTRARATQLGVLAMQQAGASPHIASELGRVCAEAGLEELSQRAFFFLSGPRSAPLSLQLSMQNLRSYARAIVDRRIATLEEVESLIAEYDAAKAWTFRHWWGSLFNELLARVPG
jgi:ubiquinone/menaquinone biosynthesis C-methylase UbiE